MNNITKKNIFIFVEIMCSTENRYVMLNLDNYLSLHDYIILSRTL